MKVAAFLIWICMSVAASAQETTRELWVMWTTGEHVLHDGTQLPFWGFSKSFAQPELPGPLMTSVEGDSLILDVRNQSQPYAHTMHLHGTDVEQEYDGVPDLSWKIKHMETGTYRMLTPHPGLYFYHCHVASTLHVQLGMYGPLLVLPKDPTESWEGGYAVSPERTVTVLSDVDVSWHNNVPEHPHGDSDSVEFVLPAFEPDYFLFHGQSNESIDVEFPQGTSMWYVGNIGFTATRILDLHTLGVATVVSSDGRPLPQELLTDSLLIMPGERYGLLVQEQNGEVNIPMQWLSMNTGEVLHEKTINSTFVTDIRETPERVQAFYDRGNGQIVVGTFQSTGKETVVVSDIAGRVVPTHVHFVNSTLYIQPLSPLSGAYLVSIVNQHTTHHAKVLIHP